MVKKKGSDGATTETTTTSEETTTSTETTNSKMQNGYENGKRSVFASRRIIHRDLYLNREDIGLLGPYLKY